jgi:L-ascorbate metabolism protein UlaG (beta-lactamase superfamily)
MIVPMPRRMPSRRTFLAASAMTGLGGLGAASLVASPSWTARFVRARVGEVFQDVAPAPHKPDPGAWPDNAVTLAWLGHATVLVNFYGVRVLTDPALFPRIGVDGWIASIGPLRLTACALQPAELPDIDLVLVSHAHFDHLDTPSLAAVRGRPAAVMASKTSDLLPRRRYRSVQELGWGESVRIATSRGDVRVRAIEVKHWGARLRRDTYRGYNGYLIEREGRKLLFGGDTADTPLFASYRPLGPFEAAIMPVGAYNPWIQNHCTPEQAVALADAAGARLFVPVHHQSFELSREPFLEPIERTHAALASEWGRLALSEIGQTVRIA